MSSFKDLINTPGGGVILAGILFLVLMTNACHEGGHALMAWWMGDRRDSILRRCTLNPIKHFHWLLTLVLPLLSLYFFNFIMGGARPVLIHAGRIGPRRMALVALAGPAGNLLFAGFALAMLALGFQQGWLDDIDRIGDPFYRAALPAIWFSLLLAAINLVPIPPLDGSRVVAMFMPEGVRAVWYRLAPLGLVVVIFGFLWASSGFGEDVIGAPNPAIRNFLRVGLDNFIHEKLDLMVAFWKEVL